MPSDWLIRLTLNRNFNVLHYNYFVRAIKNRSRQRPQKTSLKIYHVFQVFSTPSLKQVIDFSIAACFKSFKRHKTCVTFKFIDFSVKISVLYFSVIEKKQLHGNKKVENNSDKCFAFNLQFQCLQEASYVTDGLRWTWIDYTSVGPLWRSK